MSSEFLRRRQAELDAERQARLTWGHRCAGEVLGIFVEMRLDFAYLGRFLARIARRGGMPTDRDTAVLARALVRGRYGPTRPCGECAECRRAIGAPIQFELELDESHAVIRDRTRPATPAPFWDEPA